MVARGGAEGESRRGRLGGGEVEWERLGGVGGEWERAREVIVCRVVKRFSMHE